MLPDASSEIELLQASLEGNTAAFEAIVGRYQSLVCAMTFSATASVERSEELAQEAFIKAWTNLSQLKDLTKFRAWLCSIARSIIKNYFRRRQRDIVGRAAPIDKIEDVSASVSQPADAAIDKEQQAIIRRALEQIPEGYREPLILFYREQKSLRQVARLLDLSEDAARTRVARGRKLLKDQVAAMVENSISRTGPGKAFTTAVVASITGLAIKGSGIAAAGLAAAGTTTVIKTVFSGIAAKIITAAAVVTIGVGAIVAYKQTAEPKQQPPAPAAEDIRLQEGNGGDTPQVNQAVQTASSVETAVPAQADDASGSVSAAHDAKTPETVVVDLNEPDGMTGVSGTIIDKATSKPIQGAEVFSRVYGSTQTVISDSKGHFELLGMEPGENRGIYVIAKGYASRRVVLHIVDNQVLWDFRIELTQSAKVAGTVTDESGKPVAGATVKTFHFTNHPVTTTNYGKFEIDGLDPVYSQNTLLVSHPEYPGVQISFRPPAAGKTAIRDVVLKPGVTIHGKVTDAGGNPLSGVTVANTKGPAMWNCISVKSDGDGFYKLSNVPAGELVLWAVTAEYAPYVERFSVDRSQADKEIDIKLDDPTLLRGKVVDEQGNPVPGVSVNMSEYKGVSNFNPWDNRIISDGRGRFTIPNAPGRGSLTLRLWADTIAGRDSELEIGPAEHIITVDRAGKIYGKVLDDGSGTAVTRFTVKLGRTNAGSNPGGGYRASWSREGHSFDSAEGFFDTGSEDLIVGAEYSMTVYASGFEPLTMDPLVVQSDDSGLKRIVFRLRPAGGIAGHVFDANGVPIAGARILLLSDDNKFEHYDNRDTAVSNSKGEFKLTEVKTDEGCLYVTAANYGSFLAASRNLLRNPDNAVRIVLEPGAAVFGRVLGPDGQAVSGVRLIVHVWSWRIDEILSSPYPTLLEAVTGADGCYEITGLPSGEISLRVSSSLNTASKRFRLRAGESKELNFGDEPGFTLTGLVRVGTKPLEQARVMVLKPDQSTKDGQTNTHGRFSISGIPRGTYRVHISYYNQASKDWFDEDREVVVESNIELDLDLGGGKVSGTIPVQFVAKEGLAVYARRWAPKRVRNVYGLGIPSNWEHVGKTSIDSQGNFTCCNMRAGRYYILLAAKQGTLGITDVFDLGELQSLENMTFNTGAGRIQISVVDQDTAEGIADAEFRVENELEASFFSRKPDKGTRMTTDEKGTAEFADLPAGRYIVSAEAPGYLTSQSQWVEVADDTVSPAIVCLERAAVAGFELSAEVRQLITADSAYLCCDVKNCDTGKSMPMVTSTGQYDGHMVMLVGEHIPDYYQPIINLPEGRYQIDYRLYQDKRGYITYTRQRPLVEGTVTVELFKGRTATITISKN